MDCLVAVRADSCARWPPGAALDLAHDPLKLRSGSLPVPAFVIGSEIDAVAAPTMAHPKAPGDGASVLPRVRLDRPGSWPRHEGEGTAVAIGAHGGAAGASRVLRFLPVYLARQ
jgi:hypothetical protein